MTTPTTASPTSARPRRNCATAEITAHVVGLAVKTEDMAKMACLPQTTGGRHFNAQNAEQVAGYIEEALLLSASEMGGVQTAAASPTAAAIVPPPPIPASGPPALHLRALLAPNTEPVGMPLFWTVTAEARPGVPLFGARAVNPTVPVTSGRYIVEARDGSISAKQTVELRDNRPATVTLMLNAGSMRVRVFARKNGRLSGRMRSLRRPTPTGRCCWPPRPGRPWRWCRQGAISCAPNSDLCVPSRR